MEYGYLCTRRFTLNYLEREKLLGVLAILAALAVTFIVTLAALTPWMDRWGATDAEDASTFPGDELLRSGIRPTVFEACRGNRTCELAADTGSEFV